jgi:hypothetical protein
MTLKEEVSQFWLAFSICPGNFKRRIGSRFLPETIPREVMTIRDPGKALRRYVFAESKPVVRG